MRNFSYPQNYFQFVFFAFVRFGPYGFLVIFNIFIPVGFVVMLVKISNGDIAQIG